MAKPRNDRGKAVTKFCLAMETHRRTEAGRVRSAKEFVAQFFPYDEHKSTDQLFVHMPNDVRGPVVSTWGIRGAKAALKDDDERIRLVVHDALVAGDVDEAIFEEGIEPAILIDWVALTEWWSFWRHGRLTGSAIQKALATARELALIDDPWFFLNLQSRGGKLKGIDVLCDTLSKDQIVGWIRKLHETGDGSPAGVIGAIGWETVLTKTAQEALLFALDQFARKAGLAPEPPAEAPKAASGTSGPIKAPAAAFEPSPAAASSPPSAEPSTARPELLAELHPTLSAPSDAVAMAEADGLAQAQATARVVQDDSGFEIAIPSSPAIDGGDSDDAPDGADQDHDEESPKLAEARAAMMQTLMSSGMDATAEPTASTARDDAPEVPEASPSSLEWPEPPITANGGTPVHPSEEPIALEEDDLQNASLSNLRVVSSPPPIPKKPGPVSSDG